MIELEKIWQVELEILDEIDRFCRSHNLKYSLAFGTLIGAVRHGGFIPWDDDIDIVMPRDDYEYLLAHWNVPGFILQNKRINIDFDQVMTKIRKDHTTFIQTESEKTASYHTGIFVDVFPTDRVAPKGLQRKIQYICCAIYLLYTRERTSSGRTKMFEELLLSIPRKKRLKIRKSIEGKILNYTKGISSYYFPVTIEDCKLFYDGNLFDEMIDIGFCGKKYMCTKEYDTFLRTQYADYMKLPPVESRTLKHHPVLVDLERNFCEILNS